MLQALCANAAPLVPGSPLILMVSGGSDSTALLMRAAQGQLDLMDGTGPRRLAREDLRVLHVNHCLRGAESDGDEAFVRDLCGRLGVRLQVERVDVAALVSGGANMEECARQERYRLAWELACRLAGERGLAPQAARILVAHTADDRAETFLMRALAGSGLGGLCGMRPTCGIVVRPLIESTKEELRDELRQFGQDWREDSTNAQDVATRSYIRHHVLAALSRRDPAFPHVLGRSLDIMAKEEDLLNRLAEEAFARLARPARPGWCVLDAAGLADEGEALAARVVRLAFEQALGRQAALDARFEAGHVRAVLSLAAGLTGPCSLPGGLQARLEGDELVLRGPTASEPPADVELPVPGKVVWGDVCLQAVLVDCAGRPACEVARERARGLSAAGLVEGRDFVLFDAAVAGGARTLAVGSPRAGERMRPFGLGASKLLSDVLPQAGVPARQRPWVPVVRASGDGPEGPACVWVGGIRLDERSAWSEKTTCLIQLTLRLGETPNSVAAPVAPTRH